MRVNSLEYVTKQIWWGREGRQKRPHEKQKVRDSTKNRKDIVPAGNLIFLIILRGREGERELFHSQLIQNFHN